MVVGEVAVAAWRLRGQIHSALEHEDRRDAAAFMLVLARRRLRQLDVQGFGERARHRVRARRVPHLRADGADGGAQRGQLLGERADRLVAVVARGGPVQRAEGVGRVEREDAALRTRRFCSELRADRIANCARRIARKRACSATKSKLASIRLRARRTSGAHSLSRARRCSGSRRVKTTCAGPP